MRVEIKPGAYKNIEQIRSQIGVDSTKTRASGKEQSTVGVSFQEILREQQVNQTSIEELKFSKHAIERLDTRNIELTEEQKERLNEGAKKARMKGIHESLVMVDEIAFVVSIKNNTVITAMMEEEHVFTNIDGAVII